MPDERERDIRPSLDELYCHRKSPFNWIDIVAQSWFRQCP